jgi:two-component system, NarL family, nitrate/nitrite response regulator NarL
VPPVRLLVAGDDPLARAGLASILSGRGDVAVAGEAAIDDAPRAAATSGADAVLLDLGASGAAPPALAAAVHAPLLALAASEAQAADAIRAGARAVLFRGASADALAAAAVAVARGLSVLDAALAHDWVRPPGAPGDGEGLTAREREVLGLLAEGLANKAIAARLGISEHTAKFHVNAILGKLGAESRAAAIVKAARLGLVAL